jgi:CheY-specific phosphatase CheX
VTLIATNVESLRRSADRTLISATGFAGAGVRGSIALGTTLGALRQSMPCVCSNEDWSAELGNQLFGRMKNRLLRNGIEIYAAMPAVMSGQHWTLPAQQGDAPPLVFSTTRGVVWLTFQVQISGELTLNFQSASQVPNEGHVLFF